MPRRGYVGEVKLMFLPSVANLAAPTAAEVTAGTDLTRFLTRDGINTPSSSSTIDISDMADRKNKRAPGTYGGDDWTFNLYRESVTADDDAWNLLTRDLAGYMAIRWFGGSDVAVAAADRLQIAEGTVSSRVPNSPTDGTGQTFQVVFAVADEEQDAVVAA